MSRAQINSQLVMQILSNKIGALTTENAMLQARVMDLESEVQKLKEPPEKKKTEPAKPAEMKKAVKPNKEDVVNGT